MPQITTLTQRENRIAALILITIGIDAANWLSQHPEQVNSDHDDSNGHLNAFKEAQAVAFETVTRREYGAGMTDRDDEMMDRITENLIANRFRLAHYTYGTEYQVAA